MKVEKAGLVALLHEVGEENTAVLLARSQPPDEINVDDAVGAIVADNSHSRRTRDEVEKTISRRWSDLVDQWA